MKVKTKYTNEYSDIDYIRRLADLYESERLFEVIVLAPQIYEKMLNEIYEFWKSHTDRRMGEGLLNEMKEVESYKLRVQKDESIRSQVTTYLTEMVRYEGLEYSESELENLISIEEFKTYFTKLENIISLRNDLVHNFYKRRIAESRIKRTAKECFEIVDVLLKSYFGKAEPEIEYYEIKKGKLEVNRVKRKADYSD